MKLIIIAAIALNRVIGKNGMLPWRIPKDIAHFKKLTTNHAVLMGRKTYESINKPLPKRRNIVLSSKPIKGVETYSSLTNALEALKNEEKVFIIGGGLLFNSTLDLVDELYLTIIQEEFEGDTFFPPYEEYVKKNFKLVSEEIHEEFFFQHFIKNDKIKELGLSSKISGKAT